MTTWALVLILVHGDGVAVVPSFATKGYCVAAGEVLQNKFHRVVRRDDGSLVNGGPTLTYECVEVR